MSIRLAPLPPRRRWFVTNLPPRERGTVLLTAELERVLHDGDKKNAPAIRSFLASFRKATSDGNPAEIHLKAVPYTEKGQGPGVLIAAFVLDAMPVAWLPVLQLPLSNQIKRIMQECDWAPRFPREKEKPKSNIKTDEEDSPRRGGFPAKPEVRLVRPR